jgi:hypothetical protein
MSEMPTIKSEFQSLSHLPQILVAIGPLHDFILFLGPNFLVLVIMATIFDD